MKGKDLANCAICAYPALERLCAQCAGTSEVFDALNVPRPVPALMRLIRKLTRQRLQSAFFYYRSGQLRMIEGVAAVCERRQVSVSKSQIIRLAVQLGLTVVKGLTAMELEGLVTAMEDRSK